MSTARQPRIMGRRTFEYVINRTGTVQSGCYSDPPLPDKQGLLGTNSIPRTIDFDPRIIDPENPRSCIQKIDSDFVDQIMAHNWTVLRRCSEEDGDEILKRYKNKVSFAEAYLGVMGEPIESPEVTANNAQQRQELVGVLVKKGVPMHMITEGWTVEELRTFIADPPLLAKAWREKFKPMKGETTPDHAPPNLVALTQKGPQRQPSA